ncbi:MAG: hypothetical protein LBB49_05510 [Gracilibacteraceae bacterium]|nr:hypothetical protein [Gracilibacteraceae bacterium]
MATATNQHPHTIQFNLHPHCPLSIVNCPLIMDSLFGNPDAPKIIYRDWAHRRVHEGNVAIWEGIEGIIYLNNLTKDPETAEKTKATKWGRGAAAGALKESSN